MAQLSKEHVKRPEKILQFGEGNFLRAFFDVFIDELNEQGLFNGSIVIVPPIPQTADSVDIINAQKGCYTVVLRGLVNNADTTYTRVVTSVSRAINMYRDFDLYMDNVKNPQLRFVVSNTTEAGIVYVKEDNPSGAPPVSFPAKITALLYERYKLFNGAPDKGFIFIPCELIDDNGLNLKKFVMQHAKDWKLPQGFIDWVNSSNYFTNTLVDRIVTGYPKDEIVDFTKTLGYDDDLLVTGEIFHFFAIEAEDKVAAEINKTLPFAKAGLDVVLTNDATPYKLRKVCILNGAHTMSVLAAFLSGKDTVGEMMADPLFVKFLRKGIYGEIIPSLLESHSGITEKDLLSFADSVFDRFANPHIKHYLISIALNSMSKFKARVLPSILDYYKKTGEFPEVLTFSFAALLAFYKGVKADGAYQVTDDAYVVEFFKAQWQRDDAKKLVEAALANIEFWGVDLTQFVGLSHQVANYLQCIMDKGVKKAMEEIL